MDLSTLIKPAMEMLLRLWPKRTPPVAKPVNRPRLLVIEDSDTDAFLLQMHIKNFGFESDHVKTAEAGEALLWSGKYPAVFIDLGLPHEDGMTLAIRIRKDLRTVFPIIFSGSSATMSMEDYPPGPGIFMMRKNGLEITKEAVEDILGWLKL